MKLTRYIHYYNPVSQTPFDQLVHELVPKRPQFKSPQQQNNLYLACLAAPHLSIVFCHFSDAEHIPQNIPAVIYSLNTDKSAHRFQYNTHYISSHDAPSLTLAEFKEQLKAFLAQLPKHIASFPIVKQNPTIFWQHPVITEKYSLEHAAKNKDIIYVGIPYATLIDKSLTPTLELVSIKTHIDALKAESPTKRVYSACQHIHYAKILELVKMLGITDLFISHKRANHPSTENGIRIHGLPLYPANVFDISRSIGIPSPLPPSTERKYLFSFIGAHMRHYLNPIRQKILSWPSFTTATPKWYIQDTKIWHFEKDVYQSQVRGIELTQSERAQQDQQTLEYNRVLSDSTFSLCPVGAGPNTIRLWESICLSSIPVIIADEFDAAQCIPPRINPSSSPFYIQLPYSSPHLASPEALAAYLASISQEQLNSMTKGCEQVADYLRTTFLSPSSAA